LDPFRTPKKSCWECLTLTNYIKKWIWGIEHLLTYNKKNGKVHWGTYLEHVHDTLKKSVKEAKL
jgi:hypothetical protein